jgi:hypothetical protein
MCTLSWLRRSDGYTVLFNRDEQRRRAPGVPPSTHHHSGLPFLAPRDPEGGGTWITVNAAGCSVLVLNRYDAPAIPLADPLSRGALVMALAGMAAEEAVAQLHRTDLSRFRPFTLALFDVGRPATLHDWDGRRLEPASVDDSGLVATSSSFDQRRAQALRRELFAAALASRPPDEALLERLHADHATDRALAPCMHRSEASTVSLTRVHVGPGQCEMYYRPGSPCGTAPTVAAALQREHPAPRGA